MTRKNRRILNIVRNLFIAALLATPIWGQFGYPLPTAEMNFRRMERMNLLPQPTEIQATVEKDGRIWIAGAGEDFVVVFQVADFLPRAANLFWYQRQSQATLMTVPVYGRWEQLPWALAVDGPKEAESARLTLNVKAQAYAGGGFTYDRVLPQPAPEGRRFINFDETYVLEGEHVGDGAFCFTMVYHYPDEDTEMGSLERSLISGIESSIAIDWEMESLFFDASGQEIGVATLKAESEE